MRCAAAVAFMLGAAACGDAAGPGTAVSAHEYGRWRGDAKANVTVDPRPLRFLPGAPPLETYDTTATVVQGRAEWVNISHADGKFFLSLYVPAGAQLLRPDGAPVADREPVDLRVRVDSVSVSFEFQPHGSYFAGERPAELWVNLEYVDLEGGIRLPQVWYQATCHDLWAQVPVRTRVAGKWLIVELRHFSNYRVAF